MATGAIGIEERGDVRIVAPNAGGDRAGKGDIRSAEEPGANNTGSSREGTGPYCPNVQWFPSSSFAMASPMARPTFM